MIAAIHRAVREGRPDCLPPVAKRARRSEHSPEIKPLCVELEARRCPGGERERRFALVDLPPGWMFRDHPICIAASGEDKTRRLPAFEEVDDLMREIATNAKYQEMMGGPWQMSHVQRHFDAQETTEDELPEWATRIGLALDEYNLLAAQLQTQVAREEQGGGLICLPKIRLVNHACDANTEIAYAPELEAGRCPCGLGHYVLLDQAHPGGRRDHLLLHRREHAVGGGRRAATPAPTGGGTFVANTCDALSRWTGREAPIGVHGERAGGTPHIAYCRLRCKTDEV